MSQGILDKPIEIKDAEPLTPEDLLAAVRAVQAEPPKCPNAPNACFCTGECLGRWENEGGTYGVGWPD
jgi:hypothetical protein